MGGTREEGNLYHDSEEASQQIKVGLFAMQGSKDQGPSPNAAVSAATMDRRSPWRFAQGVVYTA